MRAAPPIGLGVVRSCVPTGLPWNVRLNASFIVSRSALIATPSLHFSSQGGVVGAAFVELPQPKLPSHTVSAPKASRRRQGTARMCATRRWVRSSTRHFLLKFGLESTLDSDAGNGNGSDELRLTARERARRRDGFLGERCVE